MKIEFNEESKTISIFMNAKEKRRWFRVKGVLSKTLGRPASNQDVIDAALNEMIANLEAKVRKLPDSVMNTTSPHSLEQLSSPP
ncbi:MAG: hypothetical protein V4760_08305 [Bdellovibrionota bacterium]